ncbi:MAG: phosphatase PAP2 family protein [Sphaerochaetaceae bacterium]|nr:phosphatase PAP2 family protein [Sphaerochaetaceae bacterium]
MRKSSACFYRGLAFLALFIILTVLLKFVDIRAIGPMGSSVGLASVNEAGLGLFPYSRAWYKVSELCGYFSLLIAAGFAFMGLLQLIRRKSLMKVDTRILYLACLYAVVIVLYVVFDKVVINYRPVLEADGALEASFPSSHTLLAVTIFGSAAFIVKSIFSKLKVRLILERSLSFSCYFLMVLSVVSRILSGVHWITDYAGGILLGLACVSIYEGLVYRKSEEGEL